MTRKIFCFNLILAFVFITACTDNSILTEPLSDSYSGPEKDYAMEAGNDTEDEYDFIFPEDIQIKYFGKNVYSKTYDGWNNAAFISNSYLLYNLYLENTTIINVSKAGGYYPTAHYIREYDSVENREGEKIADIQFDKEGLIKEINIYGKCNDDFYITGLQVGENAKEYLNSISEGLWDRLMAMEDNYVLRGSRGHYLSHNTQKFEPGVLGESEVTIENICLSNEKLSFSYRLDGEIVDNINVFTRNDSIKDDLETEMYDINPPFYYIDDISIFDSTIEDWVKHFKIKRDPNTGEYKPYIDDILYLQITEYEYGYHIFMGKASDVVWHDYINGAGVRNSFPEFIPNDSNLYCTIDAICNDYGTHKSINIFQAINELSYFNIRGGNLGIGSNIKKYFKLYDVTAYDLIMNEGSLTSGFWTFERDEGGNISMRRDIYGLVNEDLDYYFKLDGEIITEVQVNYSK